MANVYRRKASDVLSASSKYLCKHSWIVSSRGFASGSEDDAVLIGGGPGCSIKAAQPGLKTTYLNLDYNPTKVLLHSHASHGVMVANLPGMWAQKDKAVSNLTKVNYVNGFDKSFSARRFSFTSGLKLDKIGGVEAGRILVNRQFSTNVPHKAKAIDDDTADGKDETVVTPQLSSTVPILNKISAVYLTGIVSLFPQLYMIICLTCFHNQICHQIPFSSNLTPIILDLAGLALIYHIDMGLRHLIADYTALRPKK